MRHMLILLGAFGYAIQWTDSFVQLHTEPTKMKLMIAVCGQEMPAPVESCGEGAPHVSDHDADGQRGEM